MTSDETTGHADAELERVARQVIAVNERFYEAFQTGDDEAMAAVWEHSDRATCVHPGGPILRGWDFIAQSWRDRAGPDQLSAIVITNASVTITKDVAWVTADEDVVIRDSAHTLTAMNIFVRNGSSWLLVAHHAAVVQLRSHDG